MVGSCVCACVCRGGEGNRVCVNRGGGQGVCEYMFV